MENVTCRWDEYLDEPIKEEWKTEYHKERYSDEELEKSYQSHQRLTLIDQAHSSLNGDPAAGYGLCNDNNCKIRYLTDEQKAYDKKIKHSRGWYRKGTYIVIPRTPKK